MDGINKDLKIYKSFRVAFLKRIIWSGNPGFNPIANDKNIVDAATTAIFFSYGFIFVSIKIEQSIIAFDIWGAHARKGFLLTLNWRIIGGDFKDGSRDIIIFEDLPESPAAAQVVNFPSGQRQNQIAQLDFMLSRQRFRSGKDRHIISGVTVDKIKNSMPAWISSGNKVSPGYRALRGNAGAKRKEAT